MPNPIIFDKVADIYDLYVNVDFDIPFFIKETEGSNHEILELMCGTGRVSLPLLNIGRKMVCVDYSEGMLKTFRKKTENKEFQLELICQDVTELELNRKFDLALLPFHSFSEILSTELQIKALNAISSHLEPDGIFILTLQNPKIRLKQADGNLKIMGIFPIENGKHMIMSYINQYLPIKKLVAGIQFYEVYNSSNILVEKRFLEINFKPVSDQELKEMLEETDLEIINTYGGYNYEEFNEETSNFMVYKIMKK